MGALQKLQAYRKEAESLAPPPEHSEETVKVVTEKMANDPNFFRNPANLPFPKEALSEDYGEEEYAAALIHGRSIHRPWQHNSFIRIPVAVLHFRSHHIKRLELFAHFATHAASALGIPCSQPAVLPIKRSMWTVIKSPFAYKKSQENFERKVHKRVIKAWDADPDVVDAWLRYLRRHNMGGVGMRAVKWERIPVGFGAELAPSKQVGTKEQIQTLGQKIVEEEMQAAQQ
ncbi:ribosomal protein S10 domain-containing protein [Mycena floridula]|nr:ribosomal protein S10 domain-containing protein [Mycena floridula]